MDSMASKTCSLPDQSTFFDKQSRHLSADKLVTGWLVAVWIDLVLVRHIPGPTRDSIVIALGLLRSGEFRLLGIEGIAIFVLSAAYCARTHLSVNLEDGVVWSIDIRVESQTEQMLMVVSVDTWVDFGSPAVRILAWVHCICV